MPGRRIRERAVVRFTAARYLLDTHTLFWWATEPTQIPAATRRLLGPPGAPVFASAVSVFEIVQKHRLGKLPGADALVMDLSGYAAEQGFSMLGMSARHAEVAARFPGRGDPFDRLLAAQALVDDLTLLSMDVVFDRWGVRRVW